MTYEMTLGIEHLMTGAQLVSDSGAPQRFEFASASTMRVTSSAPFRCAWHPDGTDGREIALASTPADNDLLMNFSREEIVHFAQDVARAMDLSK